MAWTGYAKSLTAASHSLFEQLQVQHDIQSLLAGQSGAFIDAARQLVTGRQYALMNRIAAYRNLADKAHWAANAVHETKADLVEIWTRPRRTSRRREKRQSWPRSPSRRCRARRRPD